MDTVASDFFSSLSAPYWLVIVVVGLGLTIFILRQLAQGLTSLIKIIQSLRYIKKNLTDRETRAFLRVRNLFVDNLRREVEYLNKEANWSDFYYTTLEAEVEVDQFSYFQASRSKTIFKLPSMVKSLATAGTSEPTRLEKNLTKAIMHSKARSFLVIGDPGSGKTVSLRHLFLKMAKACARSKDKYATIPIYLNLKRLNMSPDSVTAGSIHQWVLEELKVNQDRTMHEFLDNNFRHLLDQGVFFFLFDSFDEIPTVMDAQEHGPIVQHYADAIDRFVHGPHGGCGLVATRPYRAPRVHIGQNLTIRPLPNKRIREALDKYLIQQPGVSKQLWSELVARQDDLLDAARNPFYLNLLVGYAKSKESLPKRDYDLFEHFLQQRAEADTERLSHFGLNPAALVDKASLLAFQMLATPNIGLEASEDNIHTLVNEQPRTFNWDDSDVSQLLDALTYSQLGRKSSHAPGPQRTFAFVHRRFHEYLCARYVRENSRSIPVESLVADNHWREVLVLLCEVWPQNMLSPVFEVSRSVLKAGTASLPGSTEYHRAVETLRFLRDGFRNRMDDMPNDIRELCSDFLHRQLEYGNLLDQKRATESVSLADDKSMAVLLETALGGESAWLKETAVRSCRVLSRPTPEIESAIRKHLYELYSSFQLQRDYRSFSVVFSAKPSFYSIRAYAQLLAGVTIFKILGGLVALAFAFESYVVILATLASAIPISLLTRDMVRDLLTRMAKPIVTSEEEKESSKRNDKKVTARGTSLLHDFLGIPTTSFPLICLLLGALWTIVFGLAEAELLNKAFTILFSLALVWTWTDFGLLKQVDRFPGNLWLGVYALVQEIITSVPRNLLILLRTGRVKGLAFMILVLGAMGCSMAAFIFWGKNGFSPTVVYGEYSLALAVSSSIGMGLAALFYALTAILLLYSSWRAITLVLPSTWAFLNDHLKLAHLWLNPEARPRSALEAVNRLHEFKSIKAKGQYAQALSKWMLVADDLQVIMDEANKQVGPVRDALFKLVELWDEQTPKSGA